MVDIECSSPRVITHAVGCLQRFEHAGFDVCVIDKPPAMGLCIIAALIVAYQWLVSIELKE